MMIGKKGDLYFVIVVNEFKNLDVVWKVEQLGELLVARRIAALRTRAVVAQPQWRKCRDG